MYRFSCQRLSLIVISAHIRPAPRARAQALAIIEQTEDARKNIQELNDALQQVSSATRM